MLQLQSQRLLFRRYTMEDLSFVEAMVSDPSVMKYIGDGLPKDHTYATQLIERMLEQYKNFDDYGLHVLIHKETGERIGHAGIVAQLIDDAFEIELGYWIHPHHWHKGYGTEAALAVAHYADEEIELERYVSAIQVGNRSSQKIAVHNGMTHEKTIDMEGKRVHIYVKQKDLTEIKG